MNRIRGFTLIEVMITVAIIAILAAVAVPSYSEYVRRGRITEAVSALSGMRVKIEQHFQDNRSYATVCDNGTISKKPDDTVNFDYTCSNRTGDTFTITATGKGTLAGHTYILKENNVRSTVIASPSNWPAGTWGCWVIRKDGSC